MDMMACFLALSLNYFLLAENHNLLKLNEKEKAILRYGRIAATSIYNY